MNDDWMFGCQKPVPASSDPPPNANEPPEGQAEAPSASLAPTTSATGEGSHDGQMLTDDGQTLAPRRQTSVPNGQPGSARAWTTSVPALRSSISFANALPPIPTELATQQQSANEDFNIQLGQHKRAQPQVTAAAAAADNSSSAARQQVGASVSNWLSQQVSGQLHTSCHGSGHSLVDVSRAAVGPREVSSSDAASDTGAVGLQVKPCCQLFGCDDFVLAWLSVSQACLLGLDCSADIATYSLCPMAIMAACSRHG